MGTIISRLARAAGASALAIAFGVGMFLPAPTLADHAIDLRVVGGTSAEEVDRGTNVDFVIVVHGNANRGNVSLAVPAGLELIPGTVSEGGAATGSGVVWANADLPDGLVSFEASFRVLRTNECGSAIVSTATAAGIGSSDATLTTTCGLGGGAGQVPGNEPPPTGGATGNLPGDNDGVVRSVVYMPGIGMIVLQ